MLGNYLISKVKMMYTIYTIELILSRLSKFANCNITNEVTFNIRVRYIHGLQRNIQLMITMQIKTNAQLNILYTRYNNPKLLKDEDTQELMGKS